MPGDPRGSSAAETVLGQAAAVLVIDGTTPRLAGNPEGFDHPSVERMLSWFREHPEGTKVEGDRLAVSRRVLHPVAALKRGSPPFLAVEVGGVLHRIPPGVRHVVVGNRWSAVDPGALTVAKNAVERFELLNPSEIALMAQLHPHSVRVIGSIEPVDADLSSVAPPTDLRLNLYPYQQDGFAWLYAMTDRRLGGILADEMGLGKTPVVLATLAKRLETEGRLRALLVVPLSLVPNWIREARRFTPGLRFYVHHGPNRVLTPRLLEGAPAEVVITTYDTLVSDVPVLRLVPFDTVVLDEAQYAKNPATRRWQAIDALDRASTVAVTGTPLENSLLDLSALMALASPSVVSDPALIADVFKDRPGEAGRYVAPFVLRRRVAEVAEDLPERVDQTLWLTGFDEERLAYAKALEQAKTDGMTLAAFTKLRKLCGHVGLAEGSPVEVLSARLAERSAKIERTMVLLSRASLAGDRSIVFCSWQMLSDALALRVREDLGLPVAVVDGRIGPAERQSLIDDFNDGPPAVLVMGPRAAGVGLNIQGANHVIHLTMEWNPAVEAQATARAYRRGQFRTVFVTRLAYAGTVDELAVQRMQSKRDLFDDVIDEHTGDVPDIGLLGHLWVTSGRSI